MEGKNLFKFSVISFFGIPIIYFYSFETLENVVICYWNSAQYTCQHSRCPEKYFLLKRTSGTRRSAVQIRSAV